MVVTEDQGTAVTEDEDAQSGADDQGRPVSGDVAIGAPCTDEDGWMPSHNYPTSDAGEPQAYDVGDDVVENFDLPPGIGYCIRGPMYPDGYFTMNCSEDNNCPIEALCDSQQCRAPCEFDEDCHAPSTCEPGGEFSFCQCTECLRNECMAPSCPDE